ncbi:hypothetical protein ACAG96_07135 [Candidatus Izemoplasma sp. B36]|uniref:hypothetical protein n=1 Tax=Candidatus Izemoplasma sp. B36 TaxID=3242468 RepID=UPI003557BD4B
MGSSLVLKYPKKGVMPIPPASHTCFLLLSSKVIVPKGFVILSVAGGDNSFNNFDV